MTKQYDNWHRSFCALKRVLLPVLAMAIGLGACNSDKDTDTVQTGYVEPSDMAVTGFSLKADTRVLTGLDSVFFSIDLERGLIYNADSLPKGTRVTDLIPVIKYSNYISSAVIKMEGGQKRSGEVDYKAHPNDSIDFTGNVNLTLMSSAGASRTYRLKVNVHQSESDSLCWGEAAVGKLPSRTAAPSDQRTVGFKGLATTLLQEGDGTYTLATTADPATERAVQHVPGFGFTPRVRTLTATAEKLWILDTEGGLHSSADGLGWQAAGQTWYNIVGAYGDHVLGIKADGEGRYSFASDDGSSGGALPDGFPIEDFSDMYSYQSKWMAAPVSVIVGGVTADGQVSSAVWAYDGNSWARLSQGRIPALRGASLVPYYTFRRTGMSWNYTEYSTILLLGGKKDDGTLSRTTYISYDNGVNWSVAGSLLTLPGYIPSMWMMDNLVIFKPMTAPLFADGWESMPARKVPGMYKANTSVSGNTISWDCPYIYLFGGCGPDGALYNTIWRGVINRLTFVPVI